MSDERGAFSEVTSDGPVPSEADSGSEDKCTHTKTVLTLDSEVVFCFTSAG